MKRKKGNLLYVKILSLIFIHCTYSEPVTVATTSKFEDISSDEGEVEQQEQKQKLELRLVDEDKLKEKIIEKDETSVTDKQKAMDIPAENVSNVMDKEFDTAKDSGADVNEGKTSIDEPDASVNVDAPVAASLAEPFIEDEDEETPERISGFYFLKRGLLYF